MNRTRRSTVYALLLAFASLLTPISAQQLPVPEPAHRLRLAQAATPTAEPFVPKFIAPTIKSDFGGVFTWTNSDWFLDYASSQFIAAKFHALGIEQRPVLFYGPYHVIDPIGLKQNWLVFIGVKGDSIPIPAGFLASYYLRWDANTAEILIWKTLRDSDVLVP